MDAKQLRELGEATFGKKLGLNSLHQEVAENFYPQRADFTVKRYLGDDFAANLMTSFPPLCARELGTSFATMLRPTQKPWFEQVVAFNEQVDLEGRQWLYKATGVQRKAMYDPHSLFTKAAAQADMDYAVFGMAVMQCTVNAMGDALLHQTWHLRDCAWLENDEGRIGMFWRRWKTNARTLKKKFPKAVEGHHGLNTMARKEPFADVNCMHMIVEADTYDGNAQGRKYFSIYYDCVHNLLLEATPSWNFQYAIPRWQTVSGSQYSYSPAVVIALPEARLLQAMGYTLLEAGEKATNPPMVATEGAVRSDVAIYAGGITWADYEYDERLGEALRPLTQDLRGLPFGAEQQRDSRAILKECFFLNKIRPFIPSDDPEMTAFQAGQIVAQYIRDALPIFEPSEAEYNGQICEIDFDNLMRHGAFGSPLSMPRSLMGREIQFRFQSPLHEAIEAEKSQRFLQMRQMAGEALAMDKNAGAVVNVIEAYRDALDGIKVPPTWLNSPTVVKQLTDAAAEQDAMAQQLAALESAGKGGKDASQAALNMAEVEKVA